MKKSLQQVYEDTAVAGAIFGKLRDGTVVQLYPQASGATLKFSGQITKSEGGGTDTIYLPDSGPLLALPTNTPIFYIASHSLSFSKMYVSLSNGANLAGGETIVTKLVKNGTPVASATATLTGALSITTFVSANASFGPTSFSAGDTYDIQVLVTTATNSDGWTISVNLS